eukprot:m.39886 g.39886  ORF g.39886 m.39886 type:complete len:124 (+) comp12710_c0_seq1:221-592(+)
MLSTLGQVTMASKVFRVTQNGSFLKGLQHSLNVFGERHPDYVTKLIPAPPRHCRKLHRMLTMTIVSRSKNGYKLLAKRDRLQQEVFLVSQASPEQVQYAIDDITGKHFFRSHLGHPVPPRPES